MSFALASGIIINAWQATIYDMTCDPAESISFIHNRMTVLLPSVAVSDWINPKYKAGDLLPNAILDVQYRPAEVAKAPVQISMEI